MRSARTLTNKRQKVQPPRLLRFLTRRCATPRWSPSASQLQDMDTTATAKTVEVPYKKVCDTQMVTVCQPTPGYGYHSYG